MMEELAFPDQLAADTTAETFPAPLFKTFPDTMWKEYIQKEPARCSLQQFQTSQCISYNGHIESVSITRIPIGLTSNSFGFILLCIKQRLLAPGEIAFALMLPLSQYVRYEKNVTAGES
ncbi:MAG: hypothetical protein A2283_09950 [Lentisphaerae bacterium RIFOXYA12_FULL_48_11]|nr:MAG: hypothetical protein A2283_09950 [Lentisphaerae bacterium RIFOXYA12_FULL_48_11]